MATRESQSIDLRAVDNEEPARCHLMPCRVEHRELTIKAAEYFWPTIRQLETGGDDDRGRDKDNHTHSGSNKEQTYGGPILAASFRGRPLHGREVDLPSGVKGLVVGRDPRSTLVPSKEFRKFTYWNWDALPGEEDEIMKALQWLKVSRAIHDD